MNDNNRTHWISVAVLGATLGFLVVAQVTPWATYHDSFTTPGFSGFGVNQPSQTFETTHTAKLWEAQYASESSTGASDEGDDSWYSADWEEDGEVSSWITTIRVGIPFTVVCLVAALAAAALVLLDLNRVGAIVAGAAFVVGLTGTIVTASGINAYFDGNWEVDPTWHVGLYATVLALLGLVAGAVLALLPSPGLGLVGKARQTFSA